MHENTVPSTAVRLAIVMPVYGNWTDTFECLDNLANQTSLNFRLYLADDGSPQPPPKRSIPMHLSPIRVGRMQVSLRPAMVRQGWLQKLVTPIELQLGLNGEIASRAIDRCSPPWPSASPSAQVTLPTGCRPSGNLESVGHRQAGGQRANGRGCQFMGLAQRWAAQAASTHPQTTVVAGFHSAPAKGLAPVGEYLPSVLPISTLSPRA